MTPLLMSERREDGLEIVELLLRERWLACAAR